MSSQRNRIIAQAGALEEDVWTTDIVPLLPTDLDAHAHELGALVRKRAFASAADLLRGLLAYAVVCSSLRHLGAWGVLTETAELSAPAWLKRLRAAGPFLLWLLGRLLQSASAPTWLGQPARAIGFVDTTTFGRVGGSGDDWRLHTAYDFLAGPISSVIVTDRGGAESLSHFSLQAGEVIVADGGYGSRANVATARAAGADVLLRISPTTFPLQHANGGALDVVAWLRNAGASHHSLLAYCSHDGTQ